MTDRDFDSRDGGYIRVMNEFVDKLISYGLGKNEWKVVMLIMRGSWGIKGRPWVELRWRDIITATKLRNSTVARAMKTLKDRNFIHTIPNGKQMTRYKINAKVSTWVDLTEASGSDSLHKSGSDINEFTPQKRERSLHKSGSDINEFTPQKRERSLHKSGSDINEFTPQKRERSLHKSGSDHSTKAGVTPYKDNRKTIERKKVVFKNPQEIINQTISHLNQKLGTTFDPDLYVTQTLIIDRINEGAGIDDLKAVIDKKYSQWCDDARMVGNLRPGTLFAADKFESYLQEARRNGNKPKHNRKLQGIELMSLGLDVLTRFGDDKFSEFCDYNNLTQNDIDSIRGRVGNHTT